MATETFGAFTKGVARLSEHGELITDSSGSAVSLSDIYSVWMGNGIRATTANVTGIPAANSVHALVSGLYVSQVRFSCVNSGSGIWNISVDYERDTVVESTQEDGTLKITAKSWDTSESMVDLVVDAYSGSPVVNAAGDPFDSVPQRAIYAPSVSFIRMESRAPGALIALNGSINSSEITVLGITFPAYCGKLRMSCRDTMATSGRHYECNYTIEGRINPVLIGETLANAGWREVIVECGYNYTAGGKRYKFTETTKNSEGEEEQKEVSSPQLLSEDGGDGRGQTPVLKVVFAHRPASWASLKLPS